LIEIKDEIPQLDPSLPLNRLLKMARTSSAEPLFHITVDRSRSTWTDVIVRYYDLSGRMLWEEKVSAGSEMEFGNALGIMEKKLEIRIKNNSLPASSDRI
jgi:hypothetical protein